jgi:uncharacterized protein (TIGR03790 family)
MTRNADAKTTDATARTGVAMRYITLTAVLFTAPVFGLEPKDVFVIANKDSKESVAVANHYLEARKVPSENLILLSLPTTEDITRVDYEAKLAGPLREKLKDKKVACKVLLTVYGVPLRVGMQLPTKDEQAELDFKKPSLDLARQSLEKLEKDKGPAAEIAATKEKIARLEKVVAELSHDQSTAAVDSELMLLWWPKYSPIRWIMNPLHWQMKGDDAKNAGITLLTSRLDGPTPEIAKRLVDDAIWAEANGLKGKAYFDARGIKLDVTKPNQWTGYEGYDESFREAASLITKAGYETILDDKEPVFAANTCPDAALYAGWYSQAVFVDSTTFNRGAIGWHLASSEAVTLRDKTSKVWCPNLLQKGVAVTMGPVAEPYTVGFPKPAEFFGFLATGEYTVVECYARTTLLTSWMTTLVGDPLYHPFAKSPKLKMSDLFISPKGSKVVKE